MRRDLIEDIMGVLILLLLLITFIGLQNACVSGVEASGPREVKFYFDEPNYCPGKRIGYVVVRSTLATTEYHRVWVCGLEYAR